MNLQIAVGSMDILTMLILLIHELFPFVPSSVAGIWDGPSAAMLAISAGWKCIVPVSMIMGTLGAAIGNYLGIMCSLAMRAIIGG